MGETVGERLYGRDCRGETVGEVHSDGVANVLLVDPSAGNLRLSHDEGEDPLCGGWHGAHVLLCVQCEQHQAIGADSGLLSRDSVWVTVWFVVVVVALSMGDSYSRLLSTFGSFDSQSAIKIFYGRLYSLLFVKF